MKHIIRVAQPQTETQRIHDRIAWESTGLGIIGPAWRKDPEGRAQPRDATDPRLCCGVSRKTGTACAAYGVYVVDGQRFCVAHKPTASK